MIAVELTKQVRWPGAWQTLGVMAAIPALLTLVIGLSQPRIPERVGDWGSVVTSSSGLTMPLIALSAALLFVLPLAAAIFAGEAVAADAASGSLRYLLARPVSRSRVLGSRLAISAAFAFAAVVVMAVSALVTGALAFGWHPLTVVDLQHTTAFHLAATTLAPTEALGRILVAMVVVAGSLASVFAFTFLLSTITEMPFAAMAGGIGFGIMSRAIDNVPGMHALGPWLPVTDAGSTVWVGLFVEHVDLNAVAHLALVQASYAAVFLAVAWAHFRFADWLG